MEKLLLTENSGHSTPKNECSRREFLITTGIIGVGLYLNPVKLFAQEESAVVKMRREAAKAKITIHSLKGNISVLEGSGGNIAVFTGNDGKLLVDAGIDFSNPEMTKALSTISNAPVRHVVNTHWHFDHTDGNEWLHNKGALVTAHENTRKHLSSTITIKEWNHTFHPVPKSALPAKVFKEDLSMRFNNKDIKLKYYGQAHTDGDISVYFPDEDILHVGDTWWNPHYPFIDYKTGGSIDGMIRAAEINLETATNKTIIIPGHGSIGSRNGLAEFHDMLSTIRYNISQLKKQGKTLSETIAAKPTRNYDAKWGGGIIDPAFITSLVYRGV